MRTCVRGTCGTRVSLLGGWLSSELQGRGAHALSPPTRRGGSLFGSASKTQVGKCKPRSAGFAGLGEAGILAGSADLLTRRSCQIRALPKKAGTSGAPSSQPFGVWSQQPPGSRESPRPALLRTGPALPAPRQPPGAGCTPAGKAGRRLVRSLLLRPKNPGAPGGRRAAAASS